MTLPTLPADYTPRLGLLDGRVILVTGAGGAIGGAVSLACAQLGATVVLVGKTAAKLEAVYDRIAATAAPTPAILPMNLLSASWGDYQSLAETLEQEFGRLDGIVHAAAHFKAFTRLEDLDPREWLDALQVNLTAPYTLTRLLLPLLRRAADASVVFMADQGGREARPFHGVYGVSKASCETMMRTWAQELASERQLRFNSYYPGPVRSALRKRGYVADPPNQESQPPEACVPGLLWLLGPDSTGVSGQAF
jgi:NAD(P)-dependent dehydrogenase (short-subunit alcohol dehydrogenase family)